MSDSSAMIVVIFIFILLAAGGGTAFWYFYVYKPSLGPAPAPVYISPPAIYTSPPSSPPPSEEEESPGPDDDDYDPLELGEVESPAGSPSASFSIALWKKMMKKKFEKKRDILQKRLKVLEKARDDDKESSGTVPSEYFDQAIAYIKTLIKKAPMPAPKMKSPPPKAKFTIAAWKVGARNFFKGKTPAAIQNAIDDLVSARNDKLPKKNDVPRVHYNEAIEWLKFLKKEAEKPFNLEKWKAMISKELKGKKDSVIQARIKTLETAKAKNEASKDGVPRARYGNAIAFLKTLLKTPPSKFNIATWKTTVEKNLKGKSKTVIQKEIDQFDQKYKTVPKSEKPKAIAFLKTLKTKAKK